MSARASLEDSSEDSSEEPAGPGLKPQVKNDFKDISRYFSREEWAKMGEFEKKRYQHVKNNYDMTLSIGNQRFGVGLALGNNSRPPSSPRVSAVPSQVRHTVPSPKESRLERSFLAWLRAELSAALATQKCHFHSPSPLGLCAFPLPLPSVPPPRMSFPFHEEACVPSQVSDLADQLSCVVEGEAADPSWMTLRILMKNGRLSSKVLM
ncbi:uncharacterized protein O8D03_021546 [Erethizon dorsatum]